MIGNESFMWRKKIFTLTLGVLILGQSFSVVETQAKENPPSKERNYSNKESITLESLDKKGQRIGNESININDIEITLYYEFTNREAELIKFQDKYKNELNFIKDKFNLDKLSMDNWKKYYDYLESLEGEEHKQLGNKLNKMLVFFCIFENTDSNNEIRALYRELIEKNKLNDIESLKQIDSLTPYTSNKVAKPKRDKRSFRGIGGMSLNNAINYAADYARTSNPRYKDYSDDGGDCTNFVSQVLFAGGIPETFAWSYNYGIRPTRSWTYAPAFANLYGVFYSTTDHFEFSKRILKGDVIGYDRAGAGKWNHMAFISDADNNWAWYTLKNGERKAYYDYKVAQHSGKYLAWTSTQENGWDDAEGGTFTYGIIGR